MGENIYNIGIFGADPFCGNLGVQALAYSTIYIFERIAKDQNIKFSYSFFGSTGNLVDQISIDENITVFRNFEGIDYTKLKSWFKLILKKKTGLKELLMLNLIVDIGGGDSYSDIYGEKRFYKLNSTKQMAYFLKKKIILFPQTIGPFTNKEIEKVAFKTLNKIDLIFARDNKSFSYVSENINVEKLVNSIDCAFFLPYFKNEFKNDSTHIGINISALLWHGGYTQNNQFGLNLNYEEFTIKLIERLVAIPNVILHIIGHVIAHDLQDYDSDENDYKICELIHTRFPETVLAPKFLNPIEAKSYISGLSFFAGARMHACIAAFSSGVPVYPLAYSRKFTGLFVESLSYNFVGDMTLNTSDEIITDLIKALNTKDILKADISRSMEIVYSRINNLILKISDLFK